MSSGLSLPQIPKDLSQRLEKNIEEFYKITKQLKDAHLENFEIKKCVDDIRSRHKPTPSISVSQLNEDKYLKGIHELFIFYAKQQKIIKYKSTFQDYYQESNHLSIGEFIKFCKDFEIISKQKLTKKEIIEIFKINSSWKREMNEIEFNKALQYTANSIYNGKSKENLIKLLDFLHANDLSYIKNTAKGFCLPFSTEKIESRFKIDKIRMPSDKNLPRVSSLGGKKLQLSKNYNKKIRKQKLPCDAIVTHLKKNSYSAYFVKKSNPMSFTWQTLSSLPSEGFEFNSILTRLVSDEENSDDELLLKQYGSIKGSQQS